MSAEWPQCPDVQMSKVSEPTVLLFPQLEKPSEG